MKNKSTTYTIIATAVFGLAVQAASAAGIVASIEKAPVSADGNVSGVPADFVITLDRSLDHNIPGRSLAEGDVIRVILPPEFDLGNLNPAFPLRDIPFPDDELPCFPGALECTSAVILHGWPQQPFFAPKAFHTLSIDEEDNAFVFTAVQAMEALPPTNPGIKQLHLFLHGVVNPQPGQYRIRVEAQTGPGGTWETGTGMYHVIPKVRPSVNPTSVLVKATSGLLGPAACGPGTLPPNPHNPMIQDTMVNEDAPYVWTVLLWDGQGGPIGDAVLQWANAGHAEILRGGETIGHVRIDAPPGATGFGITVNPLPCPPIIGGAPVIGATEGIGPQPVGRMDMQFHAGDTAGVYTTTISLNKGNSTEFVVTAY